MDEPEIDPAKLYAHADKVLNHLANLVQAVFGLVEAGEMDRHDPVVHEATNAVALIMSLRKDDAKSA